METTQKLIITLLIITILFSVVSIAINLSLTDFSGDQPVRSVFKKEVLVNNAPQSGGVSLIIDSGGTG